MRLYHERAIHRSGSFTAGDEEECFTAAGRRLGVWLTTELMDGPSVVSAEVESGDAVPYEVTGDDGQHRVFVVPSAVASRWPFA